MPFRIMRREAAPCKQRFASKGEPRDGMYETANDGSYIYLLSTARLHGAMTLKIFVFKALE